MKTIDADGKAVTLNADEAAAFIRTMQQRQFAEALAAAQKLSVPITADDMDAFLIRYASNATRFATFLHLVDNYPTTPEAYAQGLRVAYIMGGACCPRGEVLQLFAAVQDKRLIMTPDELRDYEAMPDTLRVYRGCYRTELRRHVFGISWTTRQQIAEFFAWRLNAQDSSRIVVATDIPKAKVLAYFAMRDEYEVIADIRGDAQGYTAIEQPTQLYWDYMHRGQPWD